MTFSKVFAIVFALTSIVATADAAYQPGFDATATRCRFQSVRSFYLGSPTATSPETNGSVLIEWDPRNGAVSKYEWFYTSPTVAYSTLTTSPTPPAPPTLARNLQTSGRWEFAAWVNTNLSSTYSIPGHRVTAQLYPNGVATQQIWIFAGILEQTGSGTISAAGNLECEH